MAATSSSSSFKTVEVACGERKVSLPTQLYIGGEFVDSASGKKFASIDPATEEAIVEVSEADKADVDAAVVAARKAFASWKRSSPAEREALLLRLVALLERDLDDFAALEARDNGKTFAVAKAADLPLSIQCFRYYAGWCDKINGSTYASGADNFNYTRREPVGVCGAIIPWNFPFLMLAWKIAPALCTGNVIILKSAEQTPLTALKFAALCAEAGVPPGVVNILSGYGATCGAAISEHMDIDKVAFTGSTQVGRIVMQAAARSNLKKVSLELGGKSPVIVFADADLDESVKQAFTGIFFNHGQVCTAGSRIFVEEPVYDAFLEKFKGMAEAWKVGSPFDAETMQGPQVSSQQFDTIMGYIDAGKEQGARLVCGGSRAHDKGYFIQPTIFADVSDDMKIAREEIFGPVSSVLKFNADNINEVIRRANDTPYGLAAAVFTNNLQRALTIAHNVDAGTVWVNQIQVFDSNTVFGGFKQSGIGRELGEGAIDLYTQKKCVKINIAFPQ